MIFTGITEILAELSMRYTSPWIILPLKMMTSKYFFVTDICAELEMHSNVFPTILLMMTWYSTSSTKVIESNEDHVGHNAALQ